MNGDPAEDGFGLALGVTEDGVPFGLARCAGPTDDGSLQERFERELRGAVRSTDAVLPWGDDLLVVFAGDRTVAEGAAARLRALGWSVDLYEQPFHGPIADAAGQVISGRVAVGRRVDRPEGPGPDAEVLLLLVEDDPDMRHFLRHTFEREGWKVLSVATGEAAAGAWRDRRPDVLVVDYFLPDGDGVAVCLRAREEGLDIPAMICSGSLTDEIRRAAEGIGVPATSKLNIDEVVTAVRALIADGSAGQ